jgi:hypothetical protein
MSKQFWAYLGVGLVAVGLIVAAVWSGTEPNHLALTGKIIRVRTMTLTPESALVVVDFRVTNPSGVPLVLREVSLKLDRGDKGLLTGVETSRSDVDTLFDSFPALGPKYNDVLSPPQTIVPGKTIDRMAEASFDVPESAARSRKGVILHVEDVDGAGFDIPEFTEKK